jgi:hypothetical protein
VTYRPPVNETHEVFSIIPEETDKKKTMEKEGIINLTPSYIQMAGLKSENQR